MAAQSSPRRSWSRSLSIWRVPAPQRSASSSPTHLPRIRACIRQSPRSTRRLSSIARVPSAGNCRAVFSRWRRSAVSRFRRRPPRSSSRVRAKTRACSITTWLSLPRWSRRPRLSLPTLSAGLSVRPRFNPGTFSMRSRPVTCDARSSSSIYCPPRAMCGLTHCCAAASASLSLPRRSRRADRVVSWPQHLSSSPGRSRIT